MQEEIKLPKLCEDRGRFFVWIGTDRHYFTLKGKTKAARKAEAVKAHKRFCGKLLLGEPIARPEKDRRSPPVQEGGSSPSQDSDGTSNVLVAILCDRFLKYHRPRLDKSHITHFNYAVEFLVNAFGATPANDITPKKLRSVREQMVASGRFCRKMINDYTTRLIRIFVWGCDEEYVNAMVAGAWAV